ncbi:MAG: PstS family phosphate ABC transporter substrate-binding protein [Candidatus Lambdaproteobacteria bacterium]|nr:PstS family phosphate ABC transporter substrate-binding protein [Candidatus Lambdaproteobacteria bacterium]
MSKSIILALLLGLALLVSGANAATTQAQPVSVDPAIKAYHSVGGISGNLNSIGSDTLNNLMTLWSESFRKVYPNVNIQVEGKGSSTAPPALAEGTAQLGPMSRTMKASEIEAFEKRHGFKPTRIGVALDALAVYVNKDNPLQSLTLPQVDAIFSKSRRGGLPEAIATWGQVGLSGSWANKPISLYGRNSASGTYGYFKEEALFKGDYKDTVKEQPGSAAVVLGVTEDLSGIGYSGIGYRTSGVKVLKLAEKQGEEAFDGSYEHVLSGKYPLSRMLYIYVAKAPNKPMSPVVREFLRLALSREGQQVVIKDGYLPLPASVAQRQLALLE